MLSNIGRELLMTKSATMAVSVLVLLVTLASAAPTDSYEEMDSTSDELELAQKMKQLWDVYVLPKLENSISNTAVKSVSNGDTLIDDLPILQTAEYPRIIQSSRRKRGRGIAGLDNLDIMLKNFDRSRHRPMMSVSQMNTERLRNLMSLQGRRRK